MYHVQPEANNSVSWVSVLWDAYASAAGQVACQQSLPLVLAFWGNPHNMLTNTSPHTPLMRHQL